MMKTDPDNSDTEKKINNGITGVCTLAALVVALLARTLMNIDDANHSIYLVVVFCIGFGLQALLRRIRPPLQGAGPGWSRFYKFVLTQMDIGMAFKRRK